MIHALSFDIEEHFQVLAFDCPARRRHWDTLGSRVEQNTQAILSLLDRQDIKATMFILGWVAERHPALIKEIAAAGHEIASHGYAHELLTMLSPEKFREDVRRGKGILEDLVGQAVLGYRAPTFSITRETEWALPVLVEEGFAYDSSIVPIVHDYYGIPGANPFRHVRKTKAGDLWEMPPSTCRWCGLQVPVGGGGYFRLFPYNVSRYFLKKIESQDHPLILYFHPWEIDPHQPKMNGSWLSRFRHYRNLDKTYDRLIALLQDFSFGPIRTLLSASATDQERPLAGAAAL